MCVFVLPSKLQKKLGLSQFLKLVKRRGCMAKTIENKAFLLAICRAPVATKTQDEANVRKAYKSLQQGDVAKNVRIKQM